MYILSILLTGINTIYVDIYNLTVNVDIDLNVNDVVRLTAIRDHYEYGGYIPILDNIIDIVKLTSTPTGAPAPIDMKLDDILDLNYLMPSTFNSHISYTGTLIKVGTTYYSYFIRMEGEDDSTYDLELRANMD